MKIIVLASRKGGAGKTTLACNLACEAERVGAGPVAMVDADKMQGLAQWWDARKAEAPVLVRMGGSARELADDLARQGYRLLIIDTPPAINPDVALLVDDADLVLVPVQPSPNDLRAVGSTVDMVHLARKPMVFIVNRTKPRARLTNETIVALSQHGTVAPVFVADRTDYAAAQSDGRTAPELDPSSKAAQEMADLWRYVAKRLEMSP